MKSCLICDDHAILREAVALTVSTKWPNCAMSLAIDYPAAWLAAEAHFDLCICDLSMPGSEPIQGVARLQRLQPDMPIIVLTGSYNDTQMLQLLSMGVSGFVSKASTGQVIEAAINLVLAGGRYIPPEIMASLNAGVGIEAPVAKASLTRQQRRVLECLGKGLSNKEIAAILGVAPSTIKFHVDSLLDRLEAKNRAEIVGKGRGLGLL